jgi:hypothetical protein
LDSNLVSKAKASAVEPAKPAIILPPASFLIFFADPLITASPKVTCPSAAIAVEPSRRTRITVVDRNLFSMTVDVIKGYDKSLETNAQIDIDKAFIRTLRG